MFKKVFKIGAKVIDNVLLGGAIDSLNHQRKEPCKIEKKEIVISEHGKIDYIHSAATFLSSSIPFWCLLALMFGWLDLQTIKEFIKLILVF